MIEYRIDVYNELKKVGINSTVAKETGLFGQAVMKKFKNRDATITAETLNKICTILELQPRDVLKFVETESDRKNILSKISDKTIDNHKEK